jgi:citrate lyase subunit beta/citryl-CoA lyase
LTQVSKPTISISEALPVNKQFHQFKFDQNSENWCFPDGREPLVRHPFGTLLRMDSAYRPRRTCMSVPASSERFLAKARELAVDEVMLDLEDSVAPAARDTARDFAVGALNAGGWDGRLVAVRINGASTPWAYKDVIAVVEGAPGAVDSLVLPKVTSPSAVSWLDVLLGQAEQMRSLTVGGQPAGYDFDAHHYPLMRMLVAARANGLQAIDGPYARIQDTERLRKASAGVAALGYDGKWVLHPAQVPVVNEAFTPAVEEYWRALAILAAYDRATSLDRRGAVMLGDEMIDEASRKMALVLAAKGAAAGLPEPAA